MSNPVRLADLFRFYKHGLPHQMAAISELQEAMLKADPTLLDRDQPWFRTWSASGKQTASGFAPSAPFTTLVTPHITYGEITLGEERRRFKTQGQADVALELCQFLEKARTHFGGRAVIITSGHRPEAVNRAVNGASNSEHLFKPGCGALDWYIQGVSVQALQDYCVKHWPYSTGLGAARGFVHTGVRAPGRPRVVWDY